MTLAIEVRRRLWFCIGALETQSAYDRGTRPLLTFRDFQYWPRNLNDVEISSQSTITSPESTQDRYTDMSFFLAVTKGAMCQRHLSHIAFSLATPDGTDNAGSIQNRQLEVFEQFSNFVEDLPNTFTSPPTDIQNFTLSVIREQRAAIMLLMYRPLHRIGPKFDPPSTGAFVDFDLLATATTVLEHTQKKHARPEFAKWAWFAWPKWYALAVALAELCTVKGLQADHAWEVCKRSYSEYADAVADAKGGLLWKPIAKLMRQVEAKRGPRHMQGVDPAAPDAPFYQQDRPLGGGPNGVNPFWATSQPQPFSVSVDPALEPFPANITQPMQDASWAYWNTLIDDFGSEAVWNGYVQGIE